MLKFLKNLVGLAVAVSMTAGVASAQDDYPTKPIRLIVPFGPGQAADVGARIVSEELSKILGQSIVVDNRPGAGGNIGADLVSKAEPDGYTLLVGSSGTHGITPVMLPSIGFDPIEDFVGFAYTGWTPIVVSVNPDLPVKTIQDLVDLSKKTEGGLNVAVANPGARIVLQYLKNVTGGNFVPVVYKTSGDGYANVAGGHVSVIIDSSSGSLPQIAAGSIRPLGHSSAAPSETVPDIPSLADTYPGFNLVPWNVYFAPKGTPDAVVQKLNAAAIEVLAKPEVRERLLKSGYDAAPAMSVEEIAKFVRDEAKVWGDLTREAGLAAK